MLVNAEESNVQKVNMEKAWKYLSKNTIMYL